MYGIKSVNNYQGPGNTLLLVPQYSVQITIYMLDIKLIISINNHVFTVTVPLQNKY